MYVEIILIVIHSLSQCLAPSPLSPAMQVESLKIPRAQEEKGLSGQNCERKV